MYWWEVDYRPTTSLSACEEKQSPHVKKKKKKGSVQPSRQHVYQIKAAADNQTPLWLLYKEYDTGAALEWFYSKYKYVQIDEMQID